LRKILYVLGMVLLTGLLVIGIFAVGTAWHAAGFDGTIIYSVLSWITVILYGISFFVAVPKKKSPKISSIKLTTQLRLSLGYQIFLFALLLATAFFSGTAQESPSAVFLVFVGYHVYCYLSTAFMTFDAMTEGEEIDENTYPAIFEAAKHSVQVAGLPKELAIRIFFRSNFAVSAIRFDDELRILLGTHLPAIMNAYELEAVITAELGLLLGKSPNVDVALRRSISHWQASIKNDVMCFPNFFTVYPAMRIAAKAEQHFLSCAAGDETMRLGAANQFGIPSDYVGAYAKMIAYDLFLYAPSRQNPYEGEQPPRDFQECLIREYRDFIKTPMPLFKDAVRHYTPYGEAIPLHLRMETLGVQAFTLERSVWNSSYDEESERILKIGNEDFAEDFEERYAERRKEHYLTPKAFTEQYDARVQENEPLTVTETIEAVSAFCAIGDPDRAEALLDDLLKQDPNQALASEKKGLFLLDRYDPTGIAYLEIAMRENIFSEERNLHKIRSFYRKVGDTEKENAIAKRDDTAEQREKSRSQAFSSITRAEDFAAPPLSAEILEEVTEEIRRQIGEYLDTAYLVGCRGEALEGITYITIKTVTPAGSHQVALAMKRLFLYLDNRSELFCLIHLEDKPILEALASDIDGIVIVKPHP